MLTLLVTFMSVFHALGQGAEDSHNELAGGATEQSLGRVLATVDGVPIQLGEVRQELRAVLSDRSPDAVDNPQLVQEMLQQIVRRRLALAALVTSDRAANKQDVDRELAAHRNRYERQRESLDEYLRQNGVPLECYRQRLRWELSWAAYKEAMLTEENLERLFARYRRHFDGTEVRARQILFRTQREVGGSGESLNEERGEEEEGETGQATSDSKFQTPHSALARAHIVRARIESRELTFAEAAAKYSEAPSKDQGGDVGYFPRRGVMQEAVAAAAFQLEKGEVSQPVVTPFGVHLIQITDERGGGKKLADVRHDVYRAAEARLFDTLVARGRTRAKVGYAAQ